MINGVNKLIMMKSDVLDQFDTIKACVAYRINGNVTDQIPFSLEQEITPVLKEFKGWHTDMTHMQSEDEFPQEFKDYIAFLEEHLQVPVCIVSVGPDRAQTIRRK